MTIGACSLALREQLNGRLAPMGVDGNRRGDRRVVDGVVHLAVFFFVSEGVQTFLSVQLGNFLGVAAAALLAFFIAPLRRAADRVADFAVPGARSASDYEAFRKLQVYHAALEGVFSDNQGAEKERLILQRLRGVLDIADADAERLELDLRRTGVAAEPFRGRIDPGPDAYRASR